MSRPLRIFFAFALLPVCALVLLLTVCPTPARSADKDKGETKRYPIKTGDGVDLEATFYPARGEKKDAVVLMLHDFDVRRGGNSHQQGFVDLAKELQKQGYSVLTFDFRGFGKSTNVNPKKFWLVPQNAAGAGSRTAALKMAGTISHADFASTYYPNLVNDIAAAKAFLDRKNDARDVNSGNVIVIGVGQGATLGALWMTSEFHRKKALEINLLGVPTKLDDDPEGKDLAGAVWVGLSPTLAGRRYPVQRWLLEIAKDNRVRTAFVFGDKDKSAAALADNCYAKIDRSLRLVARKPIKGTDLSDSKLLLADSKQGLKWILDPCLPAIMEARGSREWKRRNMADFAYYWVLQGGRVPLVRRAKAMNEEAPEPLPSVFLDR